MESFSPIDRIREFFEAHPEALAAYVFGSRVRGTSTEASDVDVAVLLDRDPVDSGLEGPALRLEGDLERQLRIPVDLVILNRADPDLIHRVLRDGILVLDRDPSRRISFEVRARAEYLDLQPILRRYRESSKGCR